MPKTGNYYKIFVIFLVNEVLLTINRLFIISPITHSNFQSTDKTVT